MGRMVVGGDHTISLFTQAYSAALRPIDARLRYQKMPIAFLDVPRYLH